MAYKRNGVMKIDGKQELLRRILAAAGKYKFVLLLVAAGTVLMLLPPFGGERGQDKQAEEVSAPAAYSLHQIEADMARMLSEMDGVGRAKVMLTVASDSRRVYQEDREVAYKGLSAAPEDYGSTVETVLLDRGSGRQEALQTQEIYPQYVGALVVCDGAGNPGTVLRVKEAVSVLTGLGTDRISVAKRSES